MSSRAFNRVVVLKGGPSAEREVSLVSGAECAGALRRAGYDVTEIDAGSDLAADLAAARPDCVFNALHGRWGEDGCVQGMLEWLRIPYTHSGVLASSLAMDKQRTKAVYESHGLPIADGLLVDRDTVQTEHPIEPPYVVKPYNEGSSVGVHIVSENANTPVRLDEDAPAFLLVERYVAGREMTTAVLGGKAMEVTDIISSGWYDYHAKYSAGGSRHDVPAKIPDDIRQRCLSYAETAHEALGCRGLSRTDFRWDESRGAEGLILLETNTQPGMTPTSLAPEQASHVGMSFEELCAWLVEDASCDR